MYICTLIYVLIITSCAKDMHFNPIIKPWEKARWGKHCVSLAAFINFANKILKTTRKTKNKGHLMTRQIGIEVKLLALVKRFLV
jgi:hypothetical protein